MDIIEKRVVCSVCFKDEEVILTGNIKALNIYLYNHLKKYNLLQLCETCFHDSYKLFKKDITEFLDWLDENDNRSYVDEEDDKLEQIGRLREDFDLSLDLLKDEPDKYLDNLEKYTTMLENKILTESIKI